MIRRLGLSVSEPKIEAVSVYNENYPMIGKIVVRETLVRNPVTGYDEWSNPIPIGRPIDSSGLK